MSNLIEYHIRDVIVIEVVKWDNWHHLETNGVEDVRRLSVNPMLTPLSVLNSLLVRAFNVNGDFSLHYLRRDTYQLCCIESDVELKLAYLHNSEPCLQIRLVMDSNESQSLADWDVITTSDVVRSQTTSMALSLINQVEKLMNRALDSSRNKQMTDWMTTAVNDSQFRQFLDFEGKVKSTRDMRIAVYRRGVEPSLRKVVWKHLLNVYPHGLTAQQRIDFMKLKSQTYNQMKNLWKCNQNDPIVEQTLYTVKKDVVRTDRCHHYYYGNSDDDNDNVIALLNVLTTYSLNHKDKYCQGMSDLASPLLYAMKDEAHAYVCLCALMDRLSDNFNCNGQVMSRKFAHLSQLLQYYDPEFYSYLRLQGAHELLFCYRWLLLDLKREFPFDHTLHMLEVLWSSMPSTHINISLHLFDDNFLYIPNKLTKLGPNISINSASNPLKQKTSTSRSQSLNFMTHLLSSDSIIGPLSVDTIEYESKPQQHLTLTDNKCCAHSLGSAHSVSCEDLNQLSTSSATTATTKSSSCSSLEVLSKDLSGLSTGIALLSPEQLGSNDAFMIFLCLTILLQNRDKIMNDNYDANDIQMHFDGLVRKNDVISVLDLARQLFHSYLSHWHHKCLTQT